MAWADDDEFARIRIGADDATLPRRRFARDTRMSPLAISLIVAAMVMASAPVGAFLRTRLPKHHLDSDTKEMVKIAIGFLATLAALVLGLIVGSAKSSFDARSDEVHAAAVKISLLDSNLRQLGGAAVPARELLRNVVSARVTEISGDPDSPTGAPIAGKSAPDIEALKTMLHALSPTGDAERAARSKALEQADDLAEIMSMAAARTGSSIMMPLLVLLVFWITSITIGLNLFAPRHGTILAVNVLSALSVASAIFLILEMDQPYGGLIRVSEAPLRAVLLRLGH